MKTKNVLVCSCLLVISSLAPSAFADDGSWYLGADLGRASYSGLQDIGGPFFHYYHTVDTPFIGSNTDHDTAYRLTGGYQIDQYFAVEAGYLDLGQAEIKGTVHVAPELSLERPVDDKLKTHGFVADAVGRWPIADGWSVYGRAGEFLSRVTFDQGNPSSSTTASGGKFTYGVGVVWTPSGPIGLKLGWDRFANLGDTGSTGQFSVNLLSVGVVYSF